ncbi:MAG: serine--tRNA ligase [Thermoplasmata archaeon]|nr:MAG: serine--tRNA ligase [Thermoplasmata archaeon]
MKFDLEAYLTFSSNIVNIRKDVDEVIQNINKKIFNDKKKIDKWDVDKNLLHLHIFSTLSSSRPHSLLLQIKNMLSRELGRKHHIGVREIGIKKYRIDFELEKKPLKKVSIPFADVRIDGKLVTMYIHDVDEDFVRKNYIDRMINLVREKVEQQYYEGKTEFWRLIWRSEEKKPVWSKDPTEEMIRLGWLKQGPTKGKWFYGPKAAALLRAMEMIALNEVLHPLGFQEVVSSHIVPFDIWLKTGHLEGMPGEFYYVAEPCSRDVEKWQRFIDLTKITKEVPMEELKNNLSIPSAGICYAQCPVIYWFFKGRTIAEKSLPVLVYDRTAISNRYESGGRHGIERVDEFHRIEPVYIGTKEQLLDLRDKLIERYKHVFNNILDLEWRMAWVTPWYMQQAGKNMEKQEEEQETGTIDFEAYLPYRGDRDKSEWLEFQNLSIIGDKYVKAFNIKTQKKELWSGCSGIGLERWTAVFLAQKGLKPEYWPDGFKKYLEKLPRDIKFL